MAQEMEQELCLGLIVEINCSERSDLEGRCSVCEKKFNGNLHKPTNAEFCEHFICRTCFVRNEQPCSICFSNSSSYYPQNNPNLTPSSSSLMNHNPTLSMQMPAEVSEGVTEKCPQICRCAEFFEYLALKRREKYVAITEELSSEDEIFELIDTCSD